MTCFVCKDYFPTTNDHRCPHPNDLNERVAQVVREIKREHWSNQEGLDPE